jgi:hypothetical protein
LRKKEVIAPHRRLNQPVFVLISGWGVWLVETGADGPVEISPGATGGRAGIFVINFGL